MQCEVHSGYYEHPCSFIDQRLLASAPVIWQYETSSHHDQIRIAIVREQALKYVPVQYNRKKNLFHKLIRVIQMFMRTFFVVQCHPRSIFNIKLLLNYGIILSIYIMNSWLQYVVSFSCVVSQLVMSCDGENMTYCCVGVKAATHILFKKFQNSYLRFRIQFNKFQNSYLYLAMQLAVQQK